MTEGKNGWRIKRNLTFTPDCFFCIKYPAEHALKLKGVQVAESPSRFSPREGGHPPNDTHVALKSISRLSNQMILIKLV